ncbi:MAG: 16S rRNA (cytidine1402-2'-O)-methyltransferase [Bacteroidetes bacterium HLUCCA01]|nr:MAG: 16S rRNA (cytidine1402-2'-O)-methyltransferase [Bacteroidetes bacterium HLUCCA01]
MANGTLVLIPTPLSGQPLAFSHPPEVLSRIHKITDFAVEKLQQAVHFLVKTGHPVPEYKMGFHPLDKHVTGEQLQDILAVLQQGRDVGVLSEAGCPGIADPGARLVWLCHSRNIPVEALVGPSAITLSVMYSGLNGQQFAFNGYLPVDSHRREQTLKTFEGRSANDEQTQIFIEAPFRNRELLGAMLELLQPETRLCVCWNLMADDQWVVTREVQDWASASLPENFENKPAMFLFLATPRQKAVSGKKSARSKSTGRGSRTTGTKKGLHRKRYNPD